MDNLPMAIPRPSLTLAGGLDNLKMQSAILDIIKVQKKNTEEIKNVNMRMNNLMNKVEKKCGGECGAGLGLGLQADGMPRPSPRSNQVGLGPKQNTNGRPTVLRPNQSLGGNISIDLPQESRDTCGEASLNDFARPNLEGQALDSRSSTTTHVRAPKCIGNQHNSPLTIESRKVEYKVVKEIEEDLFTAPQSCSLAHCVAADLGMTAGIAARFRDEFKNVEALRRQRKETGQVAVLSNGERNIYYLITKPCSNGKPKYEDLVRSLLELKTHCVLTGVRNLAIPRIGCGLDGLDWVQVKLTIEAIFRDADIHITVYNLPASPIGGRQENHGEQGTDQCRTRETDNFDRPNPEGMNTVGLPLRKIIGLRSEHLNANRRNMKNHRPRNNNHECLRQEQEQTRSVFISSIAKPASPPRTPTRRHCSTQYQKDFTPTPREDWPREKVTSTKLEETLVVGDSMVRRAGETVKEAGGKVMSYSGIRTEELRKRVEEDDTKSLSPKVVLLHVGTNDLKSTPSADHLMGDMYDLISSVKKKHPDAQVIVSGVLHRADVEARFIKQVNDNLKWVSGLQQAKFVDANGCIKGKDLSRDGLHPNWRGANKLGQFFRDIIFSTINKVNQGPVASGLNQGN